MILSTNLRVRSGSIGESDSPTVRQSDSPTVRQGLKSLSHS
ncbi:hypothetical protein [Microcoleus sp. D3_18_C4]